MNVAVKRFGRSCKYRCGHVLYDTDIARPVCVQPVWSVFYVLIIGPIVGLTLLSLLLTAAVARKMRKVFTLLLTAAGVRLFRGSGAKREGFATGASLAAAVAITKKSYWRNRTGEWVQTS